MAKSSHRIMVVDDMEDWCTTVCGLLTDEGYEAQAARSSEDALQLLRTSHFDLAILDISLDEMDEDNKEGVDLARQIKRVWPLTSIIMLTGYPSVETVAETRQPIADGKALADAYVEKTDTAGIVPAMQQVLGLS